MSKTYITRQKVTLILELMTDDDSLEELHENLKKGECDDAVRLCTDNKTKNDIWDRTMTEVTMIGIPHDFFYAIQRELEDEYSI